MKIIESNKMSYECGYWYMVLYYTKDHCTFDMKMFLNKKVKTFESFEEAYEDIKSFVDIYNFAMNHIEKDLLFKFHKLKDEAKKILETKEYVVVGEIQHNDFCICIKKIYY